MFNISIAFKLSYDPSWRKVIQKKKKHEEEIKKRKIKNDLML